MISYIWEREYPVQTEDCGDLWRIKPDGKREWMCNCQFEDWASIALGLMLLEVQRGFKTIQYDDDTWRTIDG